MIKISIIIPVHNRKKMTIKGLTSLNLALDNYYKKSELIEYDIVLVDDGSTDKTSDWVSKHYPNTNIIYGDGNLWWSGAINLGVNYSLDHLNPNYIMFWNDDLTVYSDYFLNLEKIVINERFKNSIIASKIFYENEQDRVFYYGGFLDKKKASLYINREDPQNHYKEIECDWTGGMGVVFSINIFKEIGVVDNINFPQYYGDADFSLRAKDAGFKIYCHNELKLLNDRNATGVYHNGSLTRYFQSLFSIRSPFNLRIHFKFAFKYFPPLLAIKFIFKKHLVYFLQIFYFHLKFFIKIFHKQQNNE
jgi:GT2 family glycosyltransferase